MGRLPGLSPRGVGRMIEEPIPEERRLQGTDLYRPGGAQAEAKRLTALGELTVQLYDAELDSAVSRSIGQANRELGDLTRAVAANPDHNARAEMYESGSTKILSELRDAIGGQYWQDKFDFGIEGSRERGRTYTALGVRKAQLETTYANILKGSEDLLDEAAKAVDPVERKARQDEALEMINTLSPVVGPATTQKLVAAAEDRIEKEDLIFRAQAAADKIWEDHPDDSPARQAAARRLGGDLRTKVFALIDNREVREAGNERAVSEAVAKNLVQRARNDLTIPDLLDMAALNSDIVPAQVNQAIRIIERREALGVVGPADLDVGDPPGAAALALQLRRMSQTDPGAFRNYPLWDHADELGSEFDALVEVKEGGNIRARSAFDQTVEETAAALHPGDDLDDVRARDRFIKEAEEEYNLYVASHHGIAPDVTASIKIKRALTARDRRGWWRSTPRRYELGKQEPQLRVVPSEMDAIRIKTDLFSRYPEMQSWTDDRLDEAVQDIYSDAQRYERSLPTSGTPPLPGSAARAPVEEPTATGVPTYLAREWDSPPVVEGEDVQPQTIEAQSPGDKLLALQNALVIYYGTPKGEKIEMRMRELRAELAAQPNVPRDVIRGVASAAAGAFKAAHEEVAYHRRKQRRMAQDFGMLPYPPVMELGTPHAVTFVAAKLRGAGRILYGGYSSFMEFMEADRAAAEATLDELLR